MHLGAGGDQGVLLELRQSVCVCSLHSSAVALWACDFCVGAIVVAKTVCCSRILAEELELVENIGGYRYSEDQI